MPLRVCYQCGGAPFFNAVGGDWSVELGPVSSMRFRKDALDLLESVLAEGFDRARADKFLGSERVRCCEGLERPVAEALAAKLGQKETHAAAVTGPLPKLGIGHAFKNGLPFVALGIGVGLGALIDPIGIGLGFLGGGGAGAAAGAWSASRMMKLLGRARVNDPLPYQLAELNTQLDLLYPKLDETRREQIKVAIEVGHRICGRVLDKDDVISLGADLDSGIGKSALGLVSEAARLGELIARDGTGEEGAAHVAALGELKQSAQKLMSELDALDT